MARWSFPWMRLGLRYVKSQDRIATALERIAEKYSPRGYTEDLPPETVTLAPRQAFDNMDIIDQVRIRLTRSLGREPDPEEITHELDGLEYHSDQEPKVTTPAQRQDRDR